MNMVDNKPNTQKKSNIFLYVLIMILYIIGASFIDFLSLAAFLLSVYVILQSRKQQVVEIMLLLASFAGIMKFSSPFTLYNFLFIVAIVRILWIDNLRISKQLMHFLFALTFVLTIGLLFAGSDTTFKVISFFTGLFFAGLVVSDIRGYDIKALIRFFSFGIIVSSLVFLMMDYLPGISRYITYDTYKVSAGVRQIRFSGLINNPNHYTISVNLAFMALTSYLAVKKAKLIDIIFLVLLLVFGIYSLSKSFVFGLLVSIIIIFAYLLKHNPSRWVKLFALSFVIGVIALQFIDTEYIELLINRVFISDGEDINSYSTGRFGIFKIYFDYFSENIRVLILGNGLFNPLERATHNFFIETVYSFGLIGTFLITATYLNLSKAGLRMANANKRSILNYAPLLVFLVRGMAVNIIASAMFPAYLIVVTLFIGENLSVVNKHTKRQLKSIDKNISQVKRGENE